MVTYAWAVPKRYVNSNTSAFGSYIQEVLHGMMYPGEVKLARVIADRTKLDNMGVPKGIDAFDVYECDLGEIEMGTVDFQRFQSWNSVLFCEVATQ